MVGRGSLFGRMGFGVGELVTLSTFIKITYSPNYFLSY